MLTGNKGEWSEPYALLKLIADRKLYMGGDCFSKLSDTFYPILKIIRNEKERDLEFSYEGDIIVVSAKKTILKVPISEFIKYAKLCFHQIKSTKKGKSTFAIPEIESFLNSISIKTLKAKSKSKNDITIQIEDSKSLFAPTLGFSIKSQMGRPSTLVNASRLTNFTYKIIDKFLSDIQIKEFNEYEEFADKFKFLKEIGANIEFESIESDVFKINLQTIDYNFDKFMSEVLLYFYENDIPSENTVANFVNKVKNRNPFGYDLSINFSIYEMIMKRFLSDYALGMRAGDVWKRDIQANGGYLVVRDDGEIICYHFYFVKSFEDYLYNNTKLETPDKRNDFGFIYEEKGQQKIKLNLQVRFIK